MTHLPTEDETPVPGELLLYTSPDGKIRLDLRIHDETLWMTQQMMAELFQTSKQNIGQHVANILQEGELQEDGNCKEFLYSSIRRGTTGETFCYLLQPRYDHFCRLPGE